MTEHGAQHECNVPDFEVEWRCPDCGEVYREPFADPISVVKYGRPQ